MRLFGSVFLLFTGSMCFAQQKRIYIANDDHIDYLWSANENTYRHAFIRMLDYYIRKGDSTIAIGSPADLQSRFNCDGSLWLWVYEKYKTPAEFRSLIDKIRSGHISVPFNAVNSCYGGMPAEAALRGMYYAGSLERRFNLNLDIALAMEHATLPLGLASLWAGSGARYSWKGICACNTPFGRGNPSERKNEVYWYTGLDGKKILMKWYSLNDTIPPGGLDKNQSLGGYSEARNPFYAVGACQRKFSSPDYKKYQIAGAFGYGWDDVQTYNSDDFINAARTRTNASYRVIVSNQQDFFTDFEKVHGPSLSTLSVTSGNERDLLCASLAEVSARVKRSLEKLRTAEAMTTLVAPNNHSFGVSMDSARINAWMGYGLYWEHDWSVFGGVATSAERAAWQRRIEKQISGYSDDLFDSARNELGKQISKTGSRERFFVFNPLGWERSDYADYLYSGKENISVIDISSGLQTEHQMILKDGRSYLRIISRNVPSVGYKVYEIGPESGKTFSTAARVSGNNTVIENGLYKVTLDQSGAIIAWFDKKKSRECVGSEKANDLGSMGGRGTLAVENSGPVSVTLKAESPDPLRHTSRITLFRDLARVEIDNRISQNFKDIKKWKFAFNLATPDTWHEEIGAVINAKLVTHGGHYAVENASYKYQSLNHFVALNEQGFGITVSNRDCYFMQLGNSDHALLDETSSTVRVLAGGRVSNPELGIIDQDGDSVFNQGFALGTHSVFDKASEMKFALEHQDPLATGTVTGTAPAYPERTHSFLKIADPRLLLWSVKPSEEGFANRGTIVRVWNLGEDVSRSTLNFNQPIAEAYEVSHVETDIQHGSFSGMILNVRVAAQGMSTYRVRFLPVKNPWRPTNINDTPLQRK